MRSTVQFTARQHGGLYCSTVPFW
eukprot:COSAG02_NODE_3007_length_7562_cov_47.125770_11_plen_23_part_01